MAKFKTAKKPNALVDENGKVCYIDLMRKFTDKKQYKCKIAENPLSPTENVLRKFATGSAYEGCMDAFGMCGYGAYDFPYESNNVMYEGNFENGEFEGEGEYRYKDGSVLAGDFKKGAITNRKLYFADGLVYTEDGWLYCKAPDRRFTLEYEGIQPGGASFMTAGQPTFELKPHEYDVGYGIYDPYKKVVSKYEDRSKLVRAPNKEERRWIKANCRAGKNAPVGPIPHLYENFNDPELSLPEPPKPAARTSIVFENYDEYEDDDSRKGRRSTAAVGPKFKAKFFYKYVNAKSISFASACLLSSGEHCSRVDSSIPGRRRSSIRVRMSQSGGELRPKPDVQAI